MKHLEVLFVTFLVVSLSIVTCSSLKRYDNYRLYSIRVENATQYSAVQEIENLPNGDYQIWNDIRFDRDVDVMVAPNKVTEFEEFVQREQLSHALKVTDIQRLIDNEQPAVRSSSFDWTSYHTYDEISAWLDVQLATYPDVLQEVPFGKSHEGRPIRAVHLSRKAGNPAVIIESNIHAREWITSATATWLLNELLTSTDPAVRELSENLDWYIIPIFNVDGFAYTHTTNRMWRKSRHNHAHLCYGTDLNRNFDFHWMEMGGASQNPCEETYAGPNPLSDVESQHLARFVQVHAAQTKLYLAFHSYGQYVLFPYGHTKVAAPNHSVLKSVGDKTKEGFAKSAGTDYFVGSTASSMYYSTGQSSDWAYGKHNISLTYTWEFRDQGRYGFILPAEQIISNAIEVLDALIATVSEARRQNIL